MATSRSRPRLIQIAVNSSELKALKHRAVDADTSLIVICRRALGFPAEVPTDDDTPVDGE